MIDALLKGKLSLQQENMEDILTSSVFGLIKYLPPEQGLYPFLKKTRRFLDNTPFFSDLPTGADISYDFWPTYSIDGCEPCEPDLVITIDPGPPGQKILILIEAKFHSGKSSFANYDRPAPTDQLAREWDNLLADCGNIGARPYFIYLTAGSFLPRDDIAESRDEFVAKRPGKNFECGWLSWHELSEIFSEEGNEIPGDVARLARRFGFARFRQISPISPRINTEWTFSGKPVVFHWKSKIPVKLSWSLAE